MIKNMTIQSTLPKSVLNKSVLNKSVLNKSVLNKSVLRDNVAKKDFGLHKHAGQYYIDWHHHTRHQLLYAEGGVLHLQTEQNQFLLPARHGAWIPHHHPHCVWSNSAELSLRTLYLMPQADDDPLLHQLRIFSISDLAREMILYTQVWDKSSPPEKVEQHFFDTIRLLLPTWLNQTLPLVLPATNHPQLDQVLAYIGQHLADVLFIDVIAKRYGFSGRTLMRLSKKELGMTLGTYIRVARIIQALELLTRPNASVTEVAYSVGYQSLGSFSNTFRQLVGVWPQTYLKKK